MLALRSPLLWTFLGGCLSGAAVIGFWPDRTPVRDDASETAPATRPPEPQAAAPAGPDHGADPAEPAVEHQPMANVSTAPPVEPAAIDDEPHVEPGSSVADVLIRLEVAYRQTVTGAAAQPVTTVTTVTQPASQETAARDLAPAVAADTQKDAPAGDTAEPLPARVAASDASQGAGNARARDVYLGDVHQTSSVHNTNVGTVHQGDVVVVQNVVSYVPYVAYPSVGYAPPTQAQTDGTRRYPFISPRSTVSNPHHTGSVFKYPGEFKYPVDLVH